MSILNNLKNRYKLHKTEVMSLDDYIKLVKTKDSGVLDSAHERLLKAIGEPEYIDTMKDSRLSIIHNNQTIRRYKTFKDFYGMEEVVSNIVDFLKQAAQGLEAKKQILYLLGPVGGGKSSLAERLKELMEQRPVYVLAYEEDGETVLSPTFDSPLALLSKDDAKELGIPERKVKVNLSPFMHKLIATKFDGDVSNLMVAKIYPSKIKQECLATTAPSDENNQDTSDLVGKVDIRKLANHSTSDPFAYSYSGGLCRSNQGMLEFIEMFKCPLDVLKPLLTSTQENQYKPNENIGMIPWEGIILAHSNQSEWETFKSDSRNEAFLDRIYTIKVPYVLAFEDEQKIYEKMIRESDLNTAPKTPELTKTMAQIAILSRIQRPKNSSIFSKMLAYNGEKMKDIDPSAMSYIDYKALEDAERYEGFSGLSTRLAFKALSKAFNHGKKPSGDSLHLLQELEKLLKTELNETSYETIMSDIEKYIKPELCKEYEKAIREAYIDSYSDYGQAQFDQYIFWADNWIQDLDCRDPHTGDVLSREDINAALEEMEKPAGIVNPKDFRNEVVNFCLRYKASKGQNPKWNEYTKIKEVIEKNIINNMEDMINIVSFVDKQHSGDSERHKDFVTKMKGMGYKNIDTIKHIVHWWLKHRKLVSNR